MLVSMRRPNVVLDTNLGAGLNARTVVGTLCEMSGTTLIATLVRAGIATAAEAVLTTNMTCIDAQALAHRAEKRGTQVPRVLQKDECIEWFASRMKLTRCEAIETAVLAGTRGTEKRTGKDVETHGRRMRRALKPLAAVFPERCREAYAEMEIKTEGDYASLLRSAPRSPGTRSVGKGREKE